MIILTMIVSQSRSFFSPRYDEMNALATRSSENVSALMWPVRMADIFDDMSSVMFLLMKGEYFSGRAYCCMNDA